MRLSYRAVRDAPMTDDEGGLVVEALDRFAAETPNQPSMPWRSTKAAIFSGVVDIGVDGSTPADTLVDNVRSVLNEIRVALPGSEWHLALEGEPLGWYQPVTPMLEGSGPGPKLLAPHSAISRQSTDGALLVFGGAAVLIAGLVVAVGFGVLSVGLALIAAGFAAIVAGAVALIVGASMRPKKPQRGYGPRT